MTDSLSRRPIGDGSTSMGVRSLASGRLRDHSRRLSHGHGQKSCEEAGESRRQKTGESCEEEEVVAKLFALGSQSLASAS